MPRVFLGSVVTLRYVSRLAIPADNAVDDVLPISRENDDVSHAVGRLLLGDHQIVRVQSRLHAVARDQNVGRVSIQVRRSNDLEPEETQRERCCDGQPQFQHSIPGEGAEAA
jgi:hypothetical protein